MLRLPVEPVQVQFIHMEINWFTFTVLFLLGWYLVNNWWSRIIDPDLHFHSESCCERLLLLIQDQDLLSVQPMFGRQGAAEQPDNEYINNNNIYSYILITRDNIIYIAQHPVI